MTKKAFDKIAAGLNEAIAIAKGEAEPPRMFVPPSVDVVAIRKRAKLSQRAFAERYGFSLAAVRDWEQRRRNPDPAARTLLLVIDREPQAVERALRGAA